MDDVTKQALLSAVRSLLITAGSALAAHGYINDASVNEVVGAIMVILPIVWGVWDKYRAERATKVREVIAVNAGVVVADSTVGATPPIPPAEAKKAIEDFVATKPSMAETLKVVPPTEGVKP